MPNLHVASDDDREREATVKNERHAVLAWLAQRPDIYVHTIVKITPTLWVLSYVRSDVEFRLTLDVQPERDPFSDD